jgi:hypothetical protein
MKKLFMFLLVSIIVVNSSISAKAQAPDPQTAVVILTTGVKVTKGVYTGGKWLYSHREQIIRAFKFIGDGFKYNHRWWACVYADGYVTYNNFRSYRTSLDAYNYFIEGHGDCDAVTGNNSQVCYTTPEAASAITDRHGAVVDIQYQDNNGQYVSSFN